MQTYNIMRKRRKTSNRHTLALGNSLHNRGRVREPVAQTVDAAHGNVLGGAADQVSNGRDLASVALDNVDVHGVQDVGGRGLAQFGGAGSHGIKDHGLALSIGMLS